MVGSSQQLNTIPSKLNETHERLAKKLTSLHIKNSPMKQLPKYGYDQLKRGVTCEACNSFSISIKGSLCICKKCGFEELVENTVLRSVSEFKNLFPDSKITTNVIYDWCQLSTSKRTIRRILQNNFNKVGVRQWSYYE